MSRRIPNKSKLCDKWLPGGYTFNDYKQAGPLTKSFIKFVSSADKYGMKATKKGFYKIMKRELRPGHNCTFFSAIKHSGIVLAHKVWNGQFKECSYTKGPNWNKYIKGEI